MLYTQIQSMQFNIGSSLESASIKKMLMGSLVQGRIMIPTSATVWPFYGKFVNNKFIMQADAQERQVRKPFVVEGHFVYQIRDFPLLYWINYIRSDGLDPSVSFIVCKSNIIRL